MKKKVFKLNRIRLALLLLTGSTLVPAVSQAVDLRAIAGTWDSPQGPVSMWGFEADTGDCNAPAPGNWTVGPELSDVPGATLTINLRNCLTDPVSIMIPGQQATFSPATITDAQGRTRVTGFAAETAPGDIGTYTWENLKAGTYLYQSGSKVAKQVPMGLYGALKVGGYAGTGADVTLLYSEVDPVLNNSAASANPLNYKPRYFLVNGEIDPAPYTAGSTDMPAVLRLLNAGLDSHIPTLNSGYFNLVAEDGNAYPYPRRQYSVHLPAGKTMDALWQSSGEGVFKVFDRHLNGMMAQLAVAQGGNAPSADSYAVNEDDVLAVAAPGVLANDAQGTSVSLVSGPVNGVLSLNADGSFIYTPAADFNGQDSFTYVTDASAVPALVSITIDPVNDAPVGGADAYEIEVATSLMVAAPGVLENDTDVDGDVLSTTSGTVTTANGGSASINSDGSFSYTPAGGEVAGDSDSFSYQVNDGNGGSATATVTLNFIAANTAPVAVDDAATTEEDTAVTVNVLDGDSDVDGDPLTVTMVTAPGNGMAVINPDNTVTYTPDAGFNGMDSFDYTIDDGRGGVDTATVTITVTSVNVAPVAVEDYTSAPRNVGGTVYTPAMIDLVANDSDADGNLLVGGVVEPGQITITTGSTTSRRGTVEATTNGVLYTPRANFRGTDTFNYTVRDALGAESNEVTVRINVR